MDATLPVDGMNEQVTPTASYVAPRETFEELYRREYSKLVGVAWALTGSSEAGEDLVQDTMIKAFLNWRKIGHFNRPGAWCLGVLTNACRSWWRRRRVADRYLARRMSDTSIPGPSEDHIAFWDAVRRLPERPRQVVVLFYVGDRPVAEVASILGVPEGTVKSDLARSRIALLAELEH